MFNCLLSFLLYLFCHSVLDILFRHTTNMMKTIWKIIERMDLTMARPKGNYETSEILFLPLEHKFHIVEPTCNVFFYYYMETKYWIFPILLCFKVVKFYKYGRALWQTENKKKVLGAKYIETLKPIKQNSVSNYCP